MYLVHLAVAAQGDPPLPAGIRQMIEAAAPDVLEHVSVHPGARPVPVIGLFLRVASLIEAESAAALTQICSAAACPQLDAWRLRRAEVPLLLHEWG